VYIFFGTQIAVDINEEVRFLKRKIILISHGEFAYGLHKALELIMGEQDNIYNFCLLNNETPNSIIEKIKKIIEPSDFVIILGDIIGGSMCNEARKLLDLPNVVLIGGVNLPLLIELAISNANTKDEVREIVDILRTSMNVIENANAPVENSVNDFLQD